MPQDTAQLRRAGRRSEPRRDGIKCRSAKKTIIRKNNVRLHEIGQVPAACRLGSGGTGDTEWHLFQLPGNEGAGAS